MEERFTKIDYKLQERYVAWHKWSIQDNLNAAKNLLTISPRNTIVLGYYAMHDRAKQYLAEIHSIMPKKGILGIHRAVIEELGKKCKDLVAKKRVLELIKAAEQKYEILEGLGHEGPAQLLNTAKKMRSDQSYYTNPQKEHDTAKEKEAEEFIKDYVEPFLSIMEDLDV